VGKIVIENAGNDGKCFDTNNNGKFFFFTYGEDYCVIRG
jgi:hypothetical protein